MGLQPSFRGARERSERQGFTLIEMILVVGILGILMLSVSPNVQGVMEIRALDNAGREILSSFQWARWQAAATKLNHRVCFTNDHGRWSFAIEIESPAGTWALKRDFPARTIPAKFDVSVILPPDASVIFLPTGIVEGFDSARNTIALTSNKLAHLGQASRRLVRFYASGSVEFSKEAGD